MAQSQETKSFQTLIFQQVRKLFEKSSQLEKGEEYRKFYEKKNVTVEIRTKNLLQEYEETLQFTANCFSEYSREMTYVIKKEKDIVANLEKIKELSAKLKDVKEEDNRLTNYLAAKQFLAYIFSVPENVEKIKKLLEGGKLLEAHLLIYDLGKSRDDLMLQLSKVPEHTNLDEETLTRYFSQVDVLYDQLFKQIRMILSRCLNIVRRDPSELVTVLRIVAREEYFDIQRVERNIMQKRWQEKTMEILEESVKVRVQGTQVDEKEDNKMWLVRYLELTRQLILQDLQIVKNLCVPCFPEKYEIFDKYVNWYHNALATYLSELIENGLDANECSTLLTWVLNTYNSDELMGHPDLIESSKNLPCLLSNDELEHLEDLFFEITAENYTSWMKNTLKLEEENWESDVQPDKSQCVSSEIPVIIFQMLEQTLEVAKAVNNNMAMRCINLGLQKLLEFKNLYKETIENLKSKYFANRNTIKYFTLHMIACSNNCLRVIELGNQFCGKYGNESIEMIRRRYWELRDECNEILIQELLLDLEQSFAKMFTREWLGNSFYIEQILTTVQDYFLDYEHLHEDNLIKFSNALRVGFTKEYVKSMLSKKLVLKDLEENKLAANQIIQEVNKVRNIFKSAISEDSLEIILLLAETLKSEIEMIRFDLHAVIKKCPDITEDHLLRLLYLRGDLSRTTVKELVASSIEAKPFSDKETIFDNMIFANVLKQIFF